MSNANQESPSQKPMSIAPGQESTNESYDGANTDSTKNPEDELSNSKIIKKGVIFTGIYIFGISIAIYLLPIKIEPIKLNELGDFLAGLFAPLAFLWLVLGYLQQGVELRQNSKALRLQVEELRRTASHAGIMVKHANETARKQRVQEEVIRRSMAQPAFSLIAYVPDLGAQAGGEVVCGDVYLRNTGHDAYISNMCLVEVYEGIPLEMYVDEWYTGPAPNGHEVKFYVHQLNQIPVKGKLHIQYIDSFQTTRSIYISFSIHSSTITTSQTTQPAFDEVENLIPL